MLALLINKIINVLTDCWTALIFERWVLHNRMYLSKLEGCIVLNKHNTLFAPKRSAICNRSFIRVLNANGISIASKFSVGLTR